MRRMRAKDILKSHKFIVALMVLCFVGGIVTAILTYTLTRHPTAYEELMQQTVLVRSLERERLGRYGSYSYYIVSEDGEFFILGSNYNKSRLGFLTEGAVANVKYTEGMHRFNFTLRRVPVKVAAEIYVDGYCVKEWVEAQPVSAGQAVLVGAVIGVPIPLIMGLILAAQIRHVKKTQKKRDERIAAKYGAKNRNKEA